MEILKILVIFAVIASSWTRSVSENEGSIQNLPDSLNLGNKLAGATINFFNAQYTALNSLLVLLNEFRRTGEGVGQIASSLSQTIYPELFSTLQNYDESFVVSK